MAGGETFPLQQPIMILILSGSTLGDVTNEPLKKLTYSIPTRKDYELTANLVINMKSLQFFTRILVEYLKFHNSDAGNQYQCF